MDPHKLFAVEPGFERSECLTDQVGFAANVQSSIVAQPLNPIHICGQNKFELVSSAYRKTPDETIILWLLPSLQKPVKPLEFSFLAMKRNHAPGTVDTSCKAGVVNRLEEIVERFYIKGVQSILLMSGKKNNASRRPSGQRP